MHLPRQQEYVPGMSNLRGLLILIVDLHCRFGHGLINSTPHHIIMFESMSSRSASRSIGYSTSPRSIPTIPNRCHTRGDTEAVWPLTVEGDLAAKQYSQCIILAR